MSKVRLYVGLGFLAISGYALWRHYYSLLEDGSSPEGWSPTRYVPDWWKNQYNEAEILHNEEKEALDDVITDLNTDITELNAGWLVEREVLEDTIEDWEGQSEVWDGEISTLETSLENKTEEADDLTDELSEITEAHTQHIQDALDWDVERDVFEEDIEGLTTELTALGIEQAAEETEWQNEIDDMSISFDDVALERDAALSNVASITLEMQELENTLNESYTDYSTLETERNNMQTELATALENQEDGITQVDIDALEVLLSSKQDELDAQLELVTEIQAAKLLVDNQLTDALANQEDGITQTDIDALDEEVAGLENDVDTAEAETSTLQTLYDTMLDEYATAEEDWDIERAELEAEIEDYAVIEGV